MHNAVLGTLDDIHHGCFIIPDGTQTGGGITLSVKVYDKRTKTLGIGSRC
jgi:hypothetical protein